MDGYDFLYAYTMAGADLAYAMFQRMVPNPGGTGVVRDMALVIAKDLAGTGNFAMPDYTSGRTPWIGDNTFSAVYIEDGVTAIGNHAFAGNKQLTSVDIPETVTHIGSSAFSGDLSLRASVRGTEPLDLSHVTSFGEAAFYNCNALGGSGGVLLNTTSGDLTEIPDRAFAATGLTQIQLNDNITRIGDSAFAHCSLSKMSTIDLPEKLTYIGDYAFDRQTDAPQQTITSLTIPEKVTYIGAYAFYNFKALETVRVETTTLAKPGRAAFGDSVNNAYSRRGQIEVGDQIVEGTIGTTFLMPDGVSEGYIAQFDNGYNCYLGDRSPMTRYPEGDVAATCLKQGKLAYKFKFLGYVDSYYQETPALGHDWGELKTHEATCETDKYTYHFCQRVNCDSGYNTVPVRVDTFPGTATGHDYAYEKTENPAIQAGQNTTVYYVCQNRNHNDKFDATKQSVGLVLNGETLQATTLMSLSDLQNALAEVGTNSNNIGTLTWYNEDEEILLQAGGQTYQVQFTPTNNRTFPGTVQNSKGDGTGESLTIQVNVSKVTLDFSHVTMSPLTQYVGDTFSPVRAVGLPDVTVDSAQSIEYYAADTGVWSSSAPELTEENAAKLFKVRVSFTYD